MELGGPPRVDQPQQRSWRRSLGDEAQRPTDPLRGHSGDADGGHDDNGGDRQDDLGEHVHGAESRECDGRLGTPSVLTRRPGGSGRVVGAEIPHSLQVMTAVGLEGDEGLGVANARQR